MENTAFRYNENCVLTLQLKLYLGSNVALLLEHPMNPLLSREVDNLSLEELEAVASRLSGQSPQVNHEFRAHQRFRELSPQKEIEISNMVQNYENRLRDLDESWKAQYKALEERTALARAAEQMKTDAALDARDTLHKKNYEKKLRRMEKELLKVQQNFSEQLSGKNAALEELRNQLDAQKRFWQEKERGYVEELMLKSARVGTLRAGHLRAERTERSVAEWEGTCQQLAETVIYVCATVKELPRSKRVLESVFSDVATESAAELARKKLVMVNKRGLRKALMQSRTVLMRLQEQRRKWEVENGAGRHRLGSPSQVDFNSFPTSAAAASSAAAPQSAASSRATHRPTDEDRIAGEELLRWQKQRDLDDQCDVEEHLDDIDWVDDEVLLEKGGSIGANLAASSASHIFRGLASHF